MICWLNGVLLPAEKATLSISDRGLLLGDGLYETMRVAKGHAVRLERHLARLHQGAKVIDLPVSDSSLSNPSVPVFSLEDAIAETIAANALDHGSLRLTITRGSGPRGIPPPEQPTPTILITAFAAGPVLSPARVITARRTRRNEWSPLAAVKSINCLDDIVARLEAREAGCDDALLLNTAGVVAEATAANIFARFGDQLLTPPLIDGCLPGITRAAILETTAREVSFTPDDLRRADEIFLTSSLGIRAVAELDGRTLPACPGPETLRLTSLLFGS